MCCDIYWTLTLAALLFVGSVQLTDKQWINYLLRFQNWTITNLISKLHKKKYLLGEICRCSLQVCSENTVLVNNEGTMYILVYTGGFPHLTMNNKCNIIGGSVSRVYYTQTRTVASVNSSKQQHKNNRHYQCSHISEGLMFPSIQQERTRQTFIRTANPCRQWRPVNNNSHIQSMSKRDKVNSILSKISEFLI